MTDGLNAPMDEVNAIEPDPFSIMSGATICASQRLDSTLAFIVFS